MRDGIFILGILLLVVGVIELGSWIVMILSAHILDNIGAFIIGIVFLIAGLFLIRAGLKGENKKARTIEQK